MDDNDSNNGGLSWLSPDFMERLRAAGAKARLKPDPLQQLGAEVAALRNDVRELKDLMHLLLDAIERLCGASGET